MRIGIDLGGTKTEGVLLGGDGDVLERRRTPTPQAEGYDAVLAGIVDHVRRLEDRAGEPCTVGVGTPGAVDPATGALQNSNTACLRGRPIGDDLSRLLGREVRLANDANCFAVAEAVAGAARGAEVVFGAILGTGCGGGVVIGGRARAGLHGIAGEWGHSPIGADGPECYCGQRGCVETRLSGAGFEAEYRRIVGAAQRGGAERTPAAEIVRRADAGEEAASRCLDRYLHWFGEGIARVIHILDPDAIVLGGGMANVPHLYDRGRAEVEAVLFHDGLLTPILRNELGDSAGVLGAAWLWEG